MELYECKVCGTLRLDRDKMKRHVRYSACNNDLDFVSIDKISLKLYVNIYEITIIGG